MLLLAVLFSIIAVLLSRTFWWRWKYDLHKIPSPPGIPLLGHTLAVLKEGELTKYRGRWWKKLGCPKVLKTYLLGNCILDIADMECLRSVVLSKTNPFPRAYLIKKGLMPMLGNDLSVKCMTQTLELTPYVKAVRRVYTTAFQTRNLKAALPKVHGIMDKMVDIIESKRQNGAVEFQSLCVKMTLDTIGMVAFDTDLGGLDDSGAMYQAIIDAGHYTIAGPLRVFRNLYCVLFPNSDAAREDRGILERLNAEWDSLTTRITGREDSPAGEEPIWYGLKRFIDPETGQSLPYKSLLAEVAFVVISGMDTTGHQLAWTLALLASHPNVVEELIKELEGHGLHGQHSRDVTFDDLGELPYLTAVVKEAMRIAHVLINGFFRRVPHDMKIVSYRVPAGTMIGVPSNRFMNSEEEWGDSDVFRPERWLTDEDMSQKFYLGFSMGPRDCVGQRLAMMEMRVALICLVTTYKLSPTVPFSELMNNSRNGIAIEARDGIWLNVEPLDHCLQTIN